MKTKVLINNLRLGLFTLFLLLFSAKGFSQACTGNQLTVTIQNVTNPTSTTVEFDIYLNNTGSTTIKLSGYTGNVRYPNNGWAAAAALSAVILPAATGNFPGLSGFPTLSNTPATGQLRWTNTPFPTEPSAVPMPPNTNLMFCRLRLTNPTPWPDNTAGNLYLSIGGAGISTNTGTVYCNGNTNSTALTLANSTLVLSPQVNFIINQPNSCFTSGSYTQTPTTCFGGGDGTATITMNPIPNDLAATYVLDGGSATPVTLSAVGSFTLSGLSAGPHTLSVTGSGSCTTPVDVPFIISGPAGPLTNTTTITACDSYTWAVTGATYTTTGPQTGTTVNGSGCTVNETLNLTINNSTSNTTTVTACGSYTWAAPLGNGQTYTTSQTGITNVSTNGANCPHTETLNLTIELAPVTTPYSVCQGGTVTGGLISTLGGSTSLPNYSGDTTGGPTFNRPVVMEQGGVCGDSGVGTAVPYVAHTFTAPVTGAYTFSNCGAASYDTILALYQAPFNPAGLCAGNTLIEASDDACGAQSTITANLVGGTSYVLVATGFANTDAGPYTITSTSPVAPPSVEWYTTPTLGTAIGTGSPFNPVGVSGSGLADTNTVGSTTFYAQFPGGTCRTPAIFTVSPTTPNTTTISACDSYTWPVNGTTYTTGGTYTSVTGCNTETLNLTINTTVDTATTISACDSYTWPVNGTTYTSSTNVTIPTPVPPLQSGIFNTSASWNATATANSATVTSSNLNGVTAANPTVLTIGTTTVTMSAPGGMYASATFVGTNLPNEPLTIAFNPPVYGASGNYFVTNISDAAIAGNLTVNYSDGTVDSQAVSAATDFFGYFSNTSISSIIITPVATTPVVNRYVSIDNLNVAIAPVVPPCQTSTLNLTINTTVNNVTTISACDSYTWPVNGTTYTSSTNVTIPTPVTPLQSGIFNTSASWNATATANSATVTSSNLNGVTAANPTVLTIGTTTVTMSAPGGMYASATFVGTNLPNEPLTIAFNPPVYGASGNYFVTNISDAAIAGNLTVNYSDGTVDSQAVSAATDFFGYFSNTSISSIIITPVATTPVVNRYVSIDNLNVAIAPVVPPCQTSTLNLTITPSTTTGSVTTSICAGGSYTWPANGVTYTTAQTGLTVVTGCNTATLNLTVTPLTTTGSVTTSICAGGSYTWPANGVTYTTAQTGLTVVTGCNTATLNLTVTPLTTTGSVTTSICAGGSYTWPANGVTYTTAQTGVTVVTGCNTATLNLTVTPLTTTGSVTTSICAGGSYTWPANGVTYTTAQTGVTVVTGCNTATLNLTVTPLTTTGSVTTSICAGGSYTWPANGVTYTTAQTGVTVVTGCNTATLNLTVTPLTTTGSVTTSICAGSSYTWPANGVTYTTAQTGLTVVTGCNTATLNLTINTAPTPTGSASQTFLNSATVASLVVSPAGVIWYPTLLDAQNGTNALLSTTALTNGSTYWAVNVVGGCRSTPFAVLVTITLGNEDFDNLNFSFYPNPTSSILNITYSRVISDILVFNMLGQQVMTKKTNETDVQIDLSSLAEATYFVKVTSEGREKIIKVIKRN